MSEATPPPGEGWDKVGTTGVGAAVRAALKRPPSRPEDQAWFKRVVAVRQLGLATVLALSLVSSQVALTWFVVTRLPTHLTEATAPVAAAVREGFASFGERVESLEAKAETLTGEAATVKGMVLGRLRCPACPTRECPEPAPTQRPAEEPRRNVKW